ncbi:MAG: hypothetical protein ABIQ90_01340 [Polaromonas sp.]
MSTGFGREISPDSQNLTGRPGCSIDSGDLPDLDQLMVYFIRIS